VLVLFLRRRLERAPGALFLAYLGLYSAGRFITEGIRTDPLMVGPMRVAQLVSLLGLAMAVVGVPLMLRRTRPTPT
jgi:phosphatidylglycerol:prolipoprotein diacylglycerol transferase